MAGRLRTLFHYIKIHYFSFFIFKDTTKTYQISQIKTSNKFFKKKPPCADSSQGNTLSLWYNGCGVGQIEEGLSQIRFSQMIERAINV